MSAHVSTLTMSCYGVHNTFYVQADIYISAYILCIHTISHAIYTTRDTVYIRFSCVYLLDTAYVFMWVFMCSLILNSIYQVKRLWNCFFFSVVTVWILSCVWLTACLISLSSNNNLLQKRSLVKLVCRVLVSIH